MKRSVPAHVIGPAAAAFASAAAFLALTLPRVPIGSVIGTGQDEWYNVVRALRVLYDHLNPAYFIHPALYYEFLALLYGLQRLGLGIAGSIGGGFDFLDYFLAHEAQFLDVARYASVGCGALAVVAAVWLGTLLSGTSGGLLAGLIIATLPLLHALAISIRVDTVGLATMIGAAALVVRSHRTPSRRSLLLAAAGIGVAAAANYPGALLLILLAWSELTRKSDDTLARPAVPLATAGGMAFAIFLLLNPYVILDLRLFLAWFFFQAEVPFLKHPHAPEPSAARYLTALWEQGPPAVLASAAGVAALSAPRRARGALAAFGLAYLAAFSLMRTQYDRFVLPAIALLCIAGAAWLCAQLARVRPWLAPVAVALLAPLIVWSAAARLLREIPWDPGEDYRAEMLGWIEQNVPASATLVIESDTMPLLQTVYDPGVEGRPFQTALRQAFEKRHPRLVRKILKAQFIAAVYNYEPALLDAGQVFFLASSRNRELIAFNHAALPQPAAFYDALDARATVVHEAGGMREKLRLYSVTSPATR